VNYVFCNWKNQAKIPVLLQNQILYLYKILTRWCIRYRRKKTFKFCI